MKTIRNVIAGGMIALAVGFAGGELMTVSGPSPLVASDCPNESCVFDMGANEYFCESSSQPTRCTLGLGPIHWSCDTCECGAVDCDEGGPLE